MAKEYSAHLKSQALMDHIKRLMPDKAKYFDPLIYKMSFILSNDNEVNAFISLLNSMYESGFYKSVEAHKDALAKLGLAANFNEEQKQADRRLANNAEKNLQAQV